MVVNEKTSWYSGSQGPSASCFVTFARQSETAQAIKHLNGAMLDGRLLRASYGTSKYCTFFLNKVCMYVYVCLCLCLKFKKIMLLEIAQAIKHLNGAMLNDRLLRASYGASKYCTFFLNKVRMYVYACVCLCLCLK